MACSPKFENKIPFDCIMQIITDVRNGTSKPLTIGMNAMWVLGCIGQTLGGLPEEDPVVAAMDNQQMAEQLSEQIGGDEISVAALDPATWAMLIQLLLRLIAEMRG